MSMLSLSIPDHVRPLRDKVLQFVEQEIYPVEAEVLADRVSSRRDGTLRGLMDKAKAEGLWALGHPEELGGGGLPFMDYVFINEVVGRSEVATVALGTHSLQDSIMLHLYASEEWREKYLQPLIDGEVFPSFGMTEPDVAAPTPPSSRPGRNSTATNGSSTAANGSRPAPTPPPIPRRWCALNPMRPTTRRFP